MSITDFFWGVLVVGTGMFMCVYGNLLFRFALAAMGFGVGFLGAFSLLEDQGAAADSSYRWRSAASPHCCSIRWSSSVFTSRARFSDLSPHSGSVH